MTPVGTTHDRAASAPAREPGPTRRAPGARKDALRRRLLFAADVARALTAIGVMTLVEGTTDPLWGLLTLPLWLVVAKMEGLYDADHPKIWHLTVDEAPAIFHWITLSVAGTLFFIRALPDETLTVESAIALYVTALVGAFALRAAARVIWRRRVPPERALVLGSGALADAVARKLALEPGHHLSVMELSKGDSGNGDGTPYVAEVDRLGELSQQDLQWLLAEARVERVALAVPELDESTLAQVVSACRAGGIKLSVVPPMRAMLGTAVDLNHIAEMPVIEYRTWGPRRPPWPSSGRSTWWSRRPPWSFSCHCWWRSRSLCGSIRADPRCSPSCVPVATASPSASSSSARCARTPRSGSQR